MFVLSDKAYNAAKKLVQVFIPGLSTLYFALANIWGLPHTEQVVGTLAAVATFGGLILGVSNSTYKAMDGGIQGSIVVTQDEEKKIFSLEFDGDPADISDMSKVTFNVRQEKLVSSPKKSTRTTKKAASS